MDDFLATAELAGTEFVAGKMLVSCLCKWHSLVSQWLIDTIHLSSCVGLLDSLTVVMFIPQKNLISGSCRRQPGRAC